MVEQGTSRFTTDSTFEQQNVKLPPARAAELCEHYRAALFEDVVPWWTRYSPDRTFGGFFSCLERNGSVYAGDKFTWMIARQIWTYSHLYNRYERREEWLTLAHHGAKFLLAHAFSPDGKMYFRMTREGRPLARCLSLYSEMFAAIGLAELGHAAQDRALWKRGVELYQQVLPRLGQPNDTAMLGYPLEAQFHLHSHDMVRMNLAWVFHELEPSTQYERDLRLSVDSLLKRHWKPEIGALLENVAPDGQPMLDLTEGRMVHPGHAIESAWMLMEIALSLGEPVAVGQETNGAPQDGALLRADRPHAAVPGKGVHVNDTLLQTAVEILLASLERGWDQTYGGLRYVTTIDGTPSHVLEADLKLWWPHCETLYALLLAWAYTGREDIGRWYEKVHDYTFGHFPDREFGEWYGYLNRDGSPVFTAKATGWKCFFHLPRSLFRSYQLLSRATQPSAASVVQRPHAKM